MNLHPEAQTGVEKARHLAEQITLSLPDDVEPGVLVIALTMIIVGIVSNSNDDTNRSNMERIEGICELLRHFQELEQATTT